MKKFITLMVAFTLLLSGCAAPVGPKESTGTLLGAGTGALLGAQVGSGRGRIVAVAIGTLAGALLGQEIGRSLDRADRLAMEQNAQYALEYTRTNQTTTWVNPDSGNSGTLTPVRTYQAAENQYCREYQQTIIVGGQEQQAYGTACRQPDGSWLIVK